MKTVLIVEDEKLIRQGIRTMVQRSGVPIEVIMECNNGEAALEILKDQKVDVMFTDIRMPKMDGLELVREVQKLSHKPQIVAVSGYDDFAYAVELLRHGVREYILKPVEREKITAILKTLEEEYEQKKAELKLKADELGAKIEKETSDFDKELLIHDAIIDSCSYADSGQLIASSAYGVLVEGSASCEGYAKAAKLLLDRAGIDNYVITGTATRDDGESEGHMWNVVFLDGQPYNLDLTWDDPIGEGAEQNKRYAYFNITDEELLKTHTFFDEAPCCTATDFNYFIKLGRQFDSYNAETKSALSKLFGGLKSGGKLDIRFSSDKAYRAALNGLIKKEEIYRILSVADAGRRGFSTTQINYITDDTHRVIEFILV